MNLQTAGCVPYSDVWKITPRRGRGGLELEIAYPRDRDKEAFNDFGYAQSKGPLSFFTPPWNDETVNKTRRRVFPFLTGFEKRSLYREQPLVTRNRHFSIVGTSEPLRLVQCPNERHLSCAHFSTNLTVIARVRGVSSGSSGSHFTVSIAAHQGDPGSVPRRVTGFSQVGIVQDDAVGRRVFSEISPAPSFRRCSILTSITVIGSQDLACVRCSPWWLMNAADVDRVCRNDAVVSQRPVLKQVRREGGGGVCCKDGNA
ncbi:hypothetical protein PR048_004240 [Dryococelus australis]|uniref:Uncharacterized protein n=1 Tax=Dryococelus australis TaxID=614101 RepID=A0ABQ9I5S3_9NEOP|nr:hypothetical protein PR048_004240 [Dryococelus australis]